jgi:hypothetical protein
VNTQKKMLQKFSGEPYWEIKTGRLKKEMGRYY